MKIRTDFVTNSSSSNEAEIVIDNPVLLDLLQRYNDLGVFGDAERNFAVGGYQSIFFGGYNNGFFGQEKTMEEQNMKPIYFDGYYDVFFRPSFEGEIPTPAFYTFERYSAEGWSSIYKHPKSLDDVLLCMISIIDNDNPKKYDQELYKQLKDELFQREKEIKNGYLKVSWIWESDDIECGDEHKWEFTYDPVNGEKCTVELFEFGGDEEGESNDGKD